MKLKYIQVLFTFEIEGHTRLRDLSGNWYMWGYEGDNPDLWVIHDSEKTELVFQEWRKNLNQLPDEEESKVLEDLNNRINNAF